MPRVKIPWDQCKNFKWRTPVKIAGNNQNLKRFLYFKPDFDGLGKILAVFDVFDG